MSRIEYRVCWNASSDITFKGSTDWIEWDGDEDVREVESLLASSDIIESLLHAPQGRAQFALPVGLEIALNDSGFEWSVEVREKGEEA